MKPFQLFSHKYVESGTVDSLKDTNSLTASNRSFMHSQFHFLDIHGQITCKKQNAYDIFYTVKNENYSISVSNTKLVSDLVKRWQRNDDDLLKMINYKSDKTSETLLKGETIGRLLKPIYMPYFTRLAAKFPLWFTDQIRTKRDQISVNCNGKFAVRCMVYTILLNLPFFFFKF